MTNPLNLNWDKIGGMWKQYKGRLREKWGRLTDDDLDKIAGRREQMIGKIQERYGIAKEEAERQVDDWMRELDKEHTLRAGGL